MSTLVREPSACEVAMAEVGAVRRGQVVYGSDGVRLGRVLQCDESGFVVERGIVFTTDYPVRYDEVARTDGDAVHLAIPGDALVPEEDAEAWDPPLDPVGTDRGVDVEPLRAGMAEVDERQRNGGTPVRRDPVRWARRPAREAARSGPVERLHLRLLDLHVMRGTRSPELERRILEEIDDYERGGGCAQPGAVTPRPVVALLPAPAGAAAPAAGRAPARVDRLDYRSSAPGAFAAMRRLEGYVRMCGLEPPLLELVRLRASQLNGCAYCVEEHTDAARARGESDERLGALATWREAPLFTDRERAALEWTEAVTLVHLDQVPDETYRVACEAFSEKQLVELSMAVIAINAWNRLVIAFRVERGSRGPGSSPPQHPHPQRDREGKDAHRHDER